MSFSFCIENDMIESEKRNYMFGEIGSLKNRLRRWRINQKQKKQKKKQL